MAGGTAEFGGGHALVVGGSVAGIVAAAALAPHFARVTLVERDHYPDAPEARKGTPQAKHVHVLLKHGEAAIETLFPGIFEELVADGGLMPGLRPDGQPDRIGRRWEFRDERHCRHICRASMWQPMYQPLGRGWAGAADRGRVSN